jgi:hypothetical protein
MTLREMPGADVHVLHQQIDELLNNEDALIVLMDGNRMVSYAHGLFDPAIILPTAIVASLLAVYLEWRARLRRQILPEREEATNGSMRRHHGSHTNGNRVSA